MIVDLSTRSGDVEDETAEDQPEPMQKTQDEISIIEKIHLWHLEEPEAESLDDQLTYDDRKSMYTQNEEPQLDDYAITHFPQAWAFLTGSQAYEWLLAKVRTAMVLTKVDGIRAEAIRNEILDGLRSGYEQGNYSCEVVEAQFHIDWDLLGFLKAKYPNELGLSLASLITMVGTGEDVQALSCAQYMDQVWPVTGSETLAAVQGAFENEVDKIHKGTQRCPIS